MPWVVDTCVLVDIGFADPAHGPRSEKLLLERKEEGLVICPVTFVELSPGFGGQISAVEDFLLNFGIDYGEGWHWEDTRRASTLWNEFVQKRRRSRISKRPVADILIAAFASRFDGLITRNVRDFSAVASGLRLIEP